MKNILMPEESEYVDIPKAKIISVVGSSIYKVKDDSGKSFNVFSESKRKVGEVVRIVRSQIVGKSNVVTKMKIFSV